MSMKPENEKPLSTDNSSNDTHKPKGYTREGAERAARMKAAIISLLNNEDKPLSKSEIEEKLSGVIKELNYKTNNFEGILYQLAKNELVKNLGKNPNGPGSIYASARNDFPVGKTFPKVPQGKRAYNKGKEGDSQLQLEGFKPTRVNEKVAPITVDIIKSSGRIRLSINGMAIEIGVIDDQ